MAVLVAFRHGAEMGDGLVSPLHRIQRFADCHGGVPAIGRVVRDIPEGGDGLFPAALVLQQVANQQELACMAGVEMQRQLCMDKRGFGGAVIA